MDSLFLSLLELILESFLKVFISFLLFLSLASFELTLHKLFILYCCSSKLCKSLFIFISKISSCELFISEILLDNFLSLIVKSLGNKLKSESSSFEFIYHL